MQQQTVKMFTRIAGTDISVGQCHPAQARTLVKKDLAAWVDGRILVILRPAFLELLESNDHVWKGPLDDANVSQAERDRRMAWFKQFVHQGADALSKPTDPQFEHIKQEAQRGIHEALQTFLVAEPVSDVTLTEVEIAEFFEMPSENLVAELEPVDWDPKLEPVELEPTPAESDLAELDPALWGVDENEENVRHYLGLRSRGLPTESKERLPNWSPSEKDWKEDIVVLPKSFSPIS